MRINDFIKFLIDKNDGFLELLSISYIFTDKKSYLYKKFFSYSEIPIKPF